MLQIGTDTIGVMSDLLHPKKREVFPTETSFGHLHILDLSEFELWTKQDAY